MTKRKSSAVPAALILGGALTVTSLMMGSNDKPAVAQSDIKPKVEIGQPLVINTQQAAIAARRAGWRGVNLVDAVAVAGAESQWNPRATHRNADGSTDYGEWQDNSKNGVPDNWRDVDVNAKKAFQIWKLQGWHAWSTVNNGKYLNYMTQAQAAVDATGGSK